MPDASLNLQRGARRLSATQHAFLSGRTSAGAEAVETPLGPALRGLQAFSMSPRFLAGAAFLLMTVASVVQLPAQHLHLTAGALSTAPGSELSFVNADTFVAASGYVFNMVLRTNGPAVGLYDGGPTFTSASGDGFEGPPAAPGARLALRVRSLAGPAGGMWSFWESLDGACDENGVSPTFTLATGATGGTNTFLLSQNNGLPGEDPYGHCHGRRSTTSKPGLHTVGVQIVDVSTNGPGGGPIHAPSAMYEFHYQAGVTIAHVARTNGMLAASFGTRNGSSYYLDWNAVLDGSQSWSNAAGPIPGNNRLRTLLDPVMAEPRRFYRLRVTTP
jgi:hypothetical protein